MAPFHLGWFQSFHVPEWKEAWGSARKDWASGDFYLHLARELEGACFDYLLLEDTLMVSDIYAGSFEQELKHPLFAPKQDVLPLAAAMTQVTSRIGLVPTLSTTFYPPYLLARAVSTLDSLSRGRGGWNVVTSAEDRAAQNFGLDRLPEHDKRYDIADEYMDLVNALWDSWEPDALVMDRDRGVFADHTKVHRVDFEGKYFKSRGPLNCVRAPQGRPVIAQAGSSPRGREFAAKHADTIVVIRKGVADMKEFRDDVRSRMEDAGRKPDECKILYLVSPILGETEDEAIAKRESRRPSADADINERLAGLSANTEIDFSRIDVDAPLEELLATGQLHTNGERGTLENFLRGGFKNLREVVMRSTSMSLDLVGTPEQVADQMGEAMDEVGGDGFLLMGANQRTDHRYIAEVAHGLVPALQRRGLTRTEYGYTQFRDNLLEF